MSKALLLEPGVERTDSPSGLIGMDDRGAAALVESALAALTSRLLRVGHVRASPEGMRLALSGLERFAEWQRLVGVVRVPKGAGRLVLLLSTDGQQTEKNVLWWDDALVIKTD